MPAPTPTSPLISLKTPGPSNFWIHVNDGISGDKIEVKRKNNGPGYWVGTISVHGNNLKGFRASVRYNPGLPPSSKSKSTKVLAAGEIIDVTITVTNTSTGSGTALTGPQVIVD